MFYGNSNDYSYQFGNFYNNLNKLQKSTDSLAAALINTNSNLSNANLSVLNLSKTIDSIKSQLQFINTQIDALTTQLTATNANIAEIASQINLLNQQYTDLLAKMNDLTNSINLTNGLIAYYPFTGNANDYSGNGNNGVVYGAILTSDRNGISNTAYNFDGLTNYISLPLLTRLNGLSKASFSFWIKTSSLNNSGTIIGHFGNNNGAVGANPGIFIGTYSSNQIMVSNYSGMSGSSSSSISQNQWHHIVVLFDGTQISNSLKTTFYVDNMQVASTVVQINNTIGNATSSFIGRRNIDFDRYGDYFKGQIDDVRVYDRILSTYEISYLYSH